MTPADIYRNRLDRIRAMASASFVVVEGETDCEASARMRLYMGRILNLTLEPLPTESGGLPDRISEAMARRPKSLDVLKDRTESDDLVDGPKEKDQ